MSLVELLLVIAGLAVRLRFIVRLSAHYNCLEKRVDFIFAVLVSDSNMAVYPEPVEGALLFRYHY